MLLCLVHFSTSKGRCLDLEGWLRACVVIPPLAVGILPTLGRWPQVTEQARLYSHSYAVCVCSVCSVGKRSSFFGDASSHLVSHPVGKARNWEQASEALVLASLGNRTECSQCLWPWKQSLPMTQQSLGRERGPGPTWMAQDHAELFLGTWPSQP